MSQREPGPSTYRDYVDTVKARCALADAKMEAADVDTVVNSVMDVTCALLRKRPVAPLAVKEEPAPPGSKQIGTATIAPGSEVPEEEDAVRAVEALRQPLSKDAKTLILDTFEKLAQARSMEESAFTNIGRLSRIVNTEQLMVIANLATTAPCQLTINKPGTTAQREAPPTGVKVKEGTRMQAIRQEMLPLWTEGSLLATTPLNHATRVLAAAVSYKILKALQQNPSINGEAYHYGVNYNRLQKALTAAKHPGGSKKKRAPATGTADDAVDLDEEEAERAEIQQSLQEDVEQRTQPFRQAKAKSVSPKKRKRDDPAEEPDVAEGDPDWGRTKTMRGYE